MGAGDFCAVYGCSNYRRHPERYVIKEHVMNFKFHSVPEKRCRKWERLLRRKDFKISKFTRVCSNHFIDGAPTIENPHPVLYLEGYGGEPKKTSKVLLPKSEIIEESESETDEIVYAAQLPEQDKQPQGKVPTGPDPKPQSKPATGPAHKVHVLRSDIDRKCLKIYLNSLANATLQHNDTTVNDCVNKIDKSRVYPKVRFTTGESQSATSTSGSAQRCYAFDSKRSRTDLDTAVSKDEDESENTQQTTKRKTPTTNKKAAQDETRLTDTETNTGKDSTSKNIYNTRPPGKFKVGKNSMRIKFPFHFIDILSSLKASNTGDYVVQTGCGKRSAVVVENKNNMIGVFIEDTAGMVTQDVNSCWTFDVGCVFTAEDWVISPPARNPPKVTVVKVPSEGSNLKLNEKRVGVANVSGMECSVEKDSLQTTTLNDFVVLSQELSDIIQDTGSNKLGPNCVLGATDCYNIGPDNIISISEDLKNSSFNIFNVGVDTFHASDFDFGSSKSVSQIENRIMDNSFENQISNIVNVDVVTAPHDVQTSQTYDVQTSQTHDVQTSQIPDVQTSQTPDVQTSQTPDVPTSQTPYVQTSQTLCVQTSQTPDVPTSQTPDVQTSQTSDVQTSQTPDVQTSQTPNVPTSQTPDVQTSQTPDVQTSQTPNVQTSQAPESSDYLKHIKKYVACSKCEDNSCFRHKRPDASRDCEVCGKSCPNPSSLRTHMLYHTGEKRHVCQYCGQTFLLKKTMNKHMRAKHLECTHACKSCGRLFETASVLKRHHCGRRIRKRIIVDLDEALAQCKIQSGDETRIDVDSEYWQKLIKPKMDDPDTVITITTDGFFMCALCCKMFKSSSSLVHHEVNAHNLGTDTGAKSYVCNLCDLDCQFASFYKAHMTTHTGERNFECKECGLSFVMRCSLASHIKTIHRGEYRYYCLKCNHGFQRQANLTAHRCENVKHRKRYFNGDPQTSYTMNTDYELVGDRLQQTGHVSTNCDLIGRGEQRTSHVNINCDLIGERRQQTSHVSTNCNVIGGSNGVLTNKIATRNDPASDLSWSQVSPDDMGVPFKLQDQNGKPIKMYKESDGRYFYFTSDNKRVYVVRDNVM